ncbi:hypothetical protein RND71_032245 [Anisodus tanguticus]|uniref:Ribosomal RNA methyltransferase SPB1-like C-terminal domain-containing protein n=1 Tax=Anisodus tanguticus TaxID=243964 RepID=A0AAE1RC89_9SOLA|nr:hypothetical protein RND71_032245 [Anisodus tanguticus]
MGRTICRIRKLAIPTKPSHTQLDLSSETSMDAEEWKTIAKRKGNAANPKLNSTKNGKDSVSGVVGNKAEHPPHFGLDPKLAEKYTSWRDKERGREYQLIDEPDPPNVQDQVMLMATHPKKRDLSISDDEQSTRIGGQLAYKTTKFTLVLQNVIMFNILFPRGLIGQNREDSGPYNRSTTINKDEKMMLRKRPREEIIDDAYNRYMFHDDGLPKWFIDEEQRHYQPVKPVTKEEIAAMKSQFKAIDARPAKKVAEAKARKKRAAHRKLEKFKKKANSISDQTEISEGSKRKMIEQLYRKAATTKKPEREYVVAKKGVQVKVGKGKVLVDPRMKADARKHGMKKKKQQGKGKGNQKGKGSGKASAAGNKRNRGK